MPKGSTPRMRGKLFAVAEWHKEGGLNPTYAGKTLPDKALPMQGARKSFTFPCGASRRCPPTVTFALNNACSGLDAHR